MSLMLTVHLGINLKSFMTIFVTVTKLMKNYEAQRNFFFCFGGTELLNTFVLIVTSSEAGIVGNLIISFPCEVQN